jgi:tape measure domain-containing protein
MVVRELVHIIGFRVNEGQLASVETRVKQLGMMMSFFTTVPIVLMGKAFIEASNSLQKLNLVIDAFSKTPEQAEQVKLGFKELAKSLPTLEVDDMHTAVTQLLARGVQIKDVVNVFRQFKVVTAATGGDINRLANAYAETLASGKLQKMYANSFIRGAKVPIYQMLADSMGITKEKAMQLVQAGKITSDMVKKAFEDATKQGSIYSDIMERRAKTLMGRWQIFKNMLFYLKADLGDKLAVPLEKVLEIIGKIVNVLKDLDGNWKRFIIIGLGVAAIAGPLVLIYTVLSKFMGPLGYITAAIGIISLIIDDIYVWVKGGDSILGLMFGDYSQYKPIIDSLKSSLWQLLVDFKDVLKEILGLIGRLVLALTDLNSTSANVDGLKGFLIILKGIAQTLDAIILATRTLINMGTAIFKGKEATEKESQQISTQASKNRLLRPFAELRDWGKEFTNIRLGALFGGDLKETFEAITGTGKFKGIPWKNTDSWQGSAGYSMAGTGGNGDVYFNPNIDMKVDIHDSGSPEYITQKIRDGVSDALEETARRIGVNRNK